MPWPLSDDAADEGAEDDTDRPEKAGGAGGTGMVEARIRG